MKQTIQQLVYRSIAVHHHYWLSEFESWFTEFTINDELCEEKAAIKAAEYCGYLLEGRGEGVYADPLARRQKQLGTRVRGQNRKACAFYRTHESFLKTLSSLKFQRSGGSQ